MATIRTVTINIEGDIAEAILPLEMELNAAKVTISSLQEQQKIAEAEHKDALNQYIEMSTRDQRSLQLQVSRLTREVDESKKLLEIYWQYFRAFKDQYSSGIASAMNKLMEACRSANKAGLRFDRNATHIAIGRVHDKARW